MLVFLSMCFVACGPKVPDPGAAVVVRFGDAVLDLQALSYYLPDSVSAEDSARLAQQAIERWIRSQAIKAEALRLMPDLEDELEPAVAHYEETMIAQSYERWLSDQNQGQLEVSETDIENYYTKNPRSLLAGSPTISSFMWKPLCLISTRSSTS